MTLSICTIVVVMRAQRPTMSASFSMAARTMSSLGTSLPRSTSLKPEFASSAPVMFLPRSWTSPLTVAMTTVPLSAVAAAGMSSLSLSNAVRMVSADKSTCGRNTFPEPKSAPMSFMAAVRDFSVISLLSWPSLSARSTRPATSSFSPSMTACLMASMTGRLVTFATAAFFGTARFAAFLLNSMPFGSVPRSAFAAMRASCIFSS